MEKEKIYLFYNKKTVTEDWGYDISILVDYGDFLHFLSESNCYKLFTQKDLDENKVDLMEWTDFIKMEITNTGHIEHHPEVIEN